MTELPLAALTPLTPLRPLPAVRTLLFEFARAALVTWPPLEEPPAFDEPLAP
jgi:hypothetical protein